MSSFVDETRIEVRSGDGGDGSVSFRREKYAPRGGPDGGDGGDGGDVIFETRRNLSTLSHLKNKPYLEAKNGGGGRKRRLHGKSGQDLVIQVPPGTRIRDTHTVLYDFPKDLEGKRWVCLSGGRGGLGNWHFKSSRNRSPRYAQEGRLGVRRTLTLELALIADVGLVGLPNAGKSSLINALTAAHSRVGAYPFTTKVPQLGVLARDGVEVILADIPGLIKGSAAGAGLGHRFLRHIGRSAVLAYLTDLNEDDPVTAVKTLEKELGTYDPELTTKSRIILGTKLDLDGGSLESLKAAFPRDRVLGVSAFSRVGLTSLVNLLLEMKADAS